MESERRATGQTAYGRPAKVANSLNISYHFYYQTRTFPLVGRLFGPGKSSPEREFAVQRAPSAICVELGELRPPHDAKRGSIKRQMHKMLADMFISILSLARISLRSNERRTFIVLARLLVCRGGRNECVTQCNV